MKNSSSMFKKLVLITGILNFPIGLGMFYQALSNTKADTFITGAVTGSFILFAGAALVWASNDIQNRASIIVWNGLVRLIGFSLVQYASANFEGVAPEMVAISFMDLVLAIVYIVGSVKISGIPFSKLIVGKIN